MPVDGVVRAEGGVGMGIGTEDSDLLPPTGERGPQTWDLSSGTWTSPSQIDMFLAIVQVPIHPPGTGGVFSGGPTKDPPYSQW